MNVYAQLISPYASSRTKQKYHLLTPGDNLQRSESKNDLDSSTDQKVLSEQSSTRYIKICVICLLVFCGYLFSDPNRDLSILTFKDLDDSGQGQFFYYKPDDSRDWFPTGFYLFIFNLQSQHVLFLQLFYCEILNRALSWRRSTARRKTSDPSEGRCLPHRAICRSEVSRRRAHRRYSLTQVMRFHPQTNENGIEGHHHKTAIETFTGIKGVCVFEVLKPDGNNEIVTLIPGVASPTSYEVPLTLSTALPV